MRVFVASASPELDSHRASACSTVRSLGWEVVEPPPDDGETEMVEARESRLAGVDLVVALVGWRSGPGPSPEEGGDGVRGWIHWEVRAALRRSLPVVVRLADESWPEHAREEDPFRRAALADLRAELRRLGRPFGPGHSDDGRFLAEL